MCQSHMGLSWIESPGCEDVKGLALDKSVLFIGRPPACGE